MNTRRLAIVGATLVILLIGAALLVTFTGVADWYCDSARFPDAEARFDVLVGSCMVNTSQGWVPEDRYRVVP